MAKTIQQLKEELAALESATGRIDSARKQRRFESATSGEKLELEQKLAQLQGTGRKLTEDEISGVRNDISLRFLQGFLDNKFSGKLLEKELERKFPGSKYDIKRLEDGNFTFSVDGSAPVEVDPSSSEDFFGEVIEQGGRLIEPIADVGVGFATMNPLAAAGTAAGFQAAREGVEQEYLGDPADPLDIGLNALTAGTLTGVGNRVGKTLSQNIGKGARTNIRKGTTKAGTPLADKFKNQAGQVLEEQSTRELEFITEGADPVKFAEKVRNNALKFKNTFESQANNAFKTGRELAEQEGSRFATDINPLLDEVADLMGDEQLNRKFLKTLTNKISQAGQKVGKPSLVNEAGETVVDFSNLSPNEIIKAREFTSQFIQANSGKPDANLLIKFKTQLNSSLDDLAKQGSDAAQQYGSGIEKIRQLNQRFSPNLQKKILGKAPVDFPSSADPVTPKEFLKKIKSGSGFDENELAQLSDVAGFADDPALRFEATQNILKEGLEGFGKGRITPNTRLRFLKQEAIDDAGKFVSDEALTQSQKSGFSIKPGQFDEALDPSNRLAAGQTFNYQSASDKLFDNRGGLGQAGEVLGGEFFEQSKPFLERGTLASQLAQGKGASFVEPGVMGAGRNQVNAAIDPGGFLGGTFRDIGKAAGAIGKAVAGDLPENIGNAFFTQAGKFDALSPELINRLSAGAGAGSSVFINNRR